MNNKNSKGVSRRSFVQTSLLGAAGLTILPGFKGFKPNENINLGFIGLGRQAMFLLNGFINIDGVKVLAAADVYGIKRKRFEQRVTDHYKKKGATADVKTYEKYQDLLARKDIDAVVIAVPDHWHALIAIDALKTGKDVYLEKPLTFTIQEGKMLRKAVRKYDRILGVGSQQRSDPNFQHAVKLVQDGELGDIEKVFVHVGAPPKPYDLPREILPIDLNWDMWLGPNPYVHYNKELNPPISLNPPQNEKIWGGWRWYKEMGGGFTTDWGAHMFDIAQWGLGMDKSGPVEAIPAGFENYKFLTYKYDNGIIMTEEPFDEKKTKGVKFQGKDGWIEVSRGYFKGSEKSYEPNLKKESGPYETKIPHQINFIEAVRSRKDPQVPVEIGHRTCTVCTLGNIAYDLRRPVKWNPAKEEFIDDLQADLYMHREYRKGYKLPVL
ncbi:MAG: Gfo/Idh/MocA family oxidoreductase [Cyclobacteriaceae bacterium]|nr:Gfo/Idh/MocA family oxidoreductase [Cyclobacteriaceae bacterium]